MAYDEAVATRIRAAFAPGVRVEEKKMFGGIAFMVAGHMSVGIVGDELMVRVGPDAHAAALARPHVRPMDFTGRPMKGFVFVAAPGFQTAAALARWVARAVAFARSQPPKARRGAAKVSSGRSERPKPTSKNRPKAAPGLRRARRS